MPQKKKKMALPMGLAGLVQNAQGVTNVNNEPAPEQESRVEAPVQQPVQQPVSAPVAPAAAQPAPQPVVAQPVYEAPQPAAVAPQQPAKELVPAGQGTPVDQVLELAAEYKRNKAHQSVILVDDVMKAFLERIKSNPEVRVSTKDIISAIVRDFAERNKEELNARFGTNL